MQYESYEFEEIYTIKGETTEDVSEFESELKELLVKYGYKLKGE